MMWTVVGFDPGARTGLVDHVDGDSTLEAAREARRRSGFSDFLCVAVYRGRLEPSALVQDIDAFLLGAGARAAPNGEVAGEHTVVAYWRYSGDVLTSAAAHTRAASGLAAMGLVQLRVAPPHELQVVAAFPGHIEPSLTAEALADDW